MLTLKIAGGVFLGIIAAFIFLQTPGWIKSRTAEQKKARAESAVERLSPESLIARCGKPLQDEKDEWSRLITYEDPLLGPGEGMVKALFLRHAAGKELVFNSIKNAVGDHFDALSHIGVLPCLMPR